MLHLSFLALVLTAAPPRAGEPLAARIDRLVEAGTKGQPLSPPADDGEFLRRVALDLAGTIPTADEVRAFTKNTTPDKRTKKVAHLLAAPTYARRMADLFHVVLMERMGDNPQWSNYLQRSFAANKPWDTLSREILRAAPFDADTRGAGFFISKRLEAVGQQTVDHAGLTRDVGRLFLGKDYRCAQCHDHLFVKEYKQADFQGLHTFLQHTYVADAAFPAIGEKPVGARTVFMSVFKRVKKETGPRLPGLREIAVPALTKGAEFEMKPDRKTRHPGVPKFSPLAELARELPQADNADFTRNIVNRLWWALMGRGLVHPLDMHHSGNAPSHPELLDLLAREFASRKFDVRDLVGELARAKAYQRSSAWPAGAKEIDPARFTAMGEKRLGAEQLLEAVLVATGEGERVRAPAKGKGPNEYATLRRKFLKAFGNPAREPEDEPAPSLAGALLVLNDRSVLDLLVPRPGNLIDRLGKLATPDAVSEELYLSVLSRWPDVGEKAEVGKALAGKAGAERARALGRLTWALLASTEFSVNH